MKTWHRFSVVSLATACFFASLTGVMAQKAIPLAQKYPIINKIPIRPPLKEMPVISVNPVTLSYAQAVWWLAPWAPANTPIQEFVDIQVRVLPIGNDADISCFVRYRLPNGTWTVNETDYPLECVSEDFYDGEDLFYGFKEFWGSLPGAECEFAIRYHTSRGDYWDNNNGNNYKLSQRINRGAGWKPEAISGSLTVKMAKAVTRLADLFPETAGVFSDSVVYFKVRNLSFNKRVGIRYTTDNWVAAHDLLASYFPPGPPVEECSIFSGVGTRDPSLEIWAVYFPAVADGVNFDFKAFYQNLDDPRQPIYWDDNFGQNYRLHSPNYICIGGILSPF